MSTMFTPGRELKNFDDGATHVTAPDLSMGALSDVVEPAPMQTPFVDPNADLLDASMNSSFEQPIASVAPAVTEQPIWDNPVPAQPAPAAKQAEDSESEDNLNPTQQLFQNLEAGVALGMAASEAKKQREAANHNTVVSAPKFTVVSAGKENWASFSRDYKPAEMEQVPCVAETTMLMQYMVAMERHRATTLSFPACGVDPKVFYEHKEKYNPDGPMVLEVDTGSPGCSTTAEYEMVEVDGVNYLSCTTDCLDPDYLHSVIAEATEAIYTHGKHIFTLIGPKPVESSMSEEGAEKVFVETLRLNSYELSALIGYMESIAGVSVEHCDYNGRSALMFTRG